MTQTLRNSGTVRAPLVDQWDAPVEASAFTTRRLLAYCLAIVSVGTAVIHFAVAGEHFQEYWMFGVFMLLSGWAQLLWSVATVWTRRPSRLVWWAGVVVNLGIVVVYVVTRVVGDVVGPTPNSPEPVGFGDLVCTIGEAILVLGCLWLAFSKRDRLVDRSVVFRATAVAGIVVATLLSVSLVAGGPEMVMMGGG